MSNIYGDPSLRLRQREHIRRVVDGPHGDSGVPPPDTPQKISIKKQHIRTYSTWDKNPCPCVEDSKTGVCQPQVPVPALPLLQSMPMKDGKSGEFTLSGACVPRRTLHNDALCSETDGSMPTPWVNVPGVLAAKVPPSQPKRAVAEYQILETIPASLVQSDATSPVPGVPTYNMAIKGVNNMPPDPEQPYQTHAAFVKELDDCEESFNMCCMYFTFLSYKCPLCNQYTCSTDQLDPETLQRLNFQEGDPTISCKNCIGTEHNVGCCTKTNSYSRTVGKTKIPAKSWNPLLPNSDNKACDKSSSSWDSTLCSLKMKDDGTPMSTTNYTDPLTKEQLKLLNPDGTQIKRAIGARGQNPNPAICRMGYAPEGAILGFENSDFECNVEQAALGCPNPKVAVTCTSDNDCAKGWCHKKAPFDATTEGKCTVRPPMNVGEDPLSDAPCYLADGSMLDSYRLAGVGVFNAIVRAARRGVKMKIIFGWPSLANSYLTYVSLMKIKWAALDKNGKEAPDNIELIPFNMANYFMGEIDNSNDSLVHVVKDCKTGKNLPIFTLNEPAKPACKKDSDCTTKCYRGTCENEPYTVPSFSGATGTSFEPGGYTAVGILHNKMYVWDNKTFYVGAQNATYDASKEMGIMIRNCPAMGADANRILNSYLHAACQQANGKTSKNFSENAKPNAALKGKKVLGSKITTDINRYTPLPVSLVPRLRPDGLDDRPRFTSTAEGSCFLTNCPQTFCNSANRTYDLEAVLCAINSSQTFCYVETYDYMEFTKFMACQQSFCLADPYTSYSPAQPSTWINNPPKAGDTNFSQYNSLNPETGRQYKTMYNDSQVNQRTGPQVQFLLVRDALYQAALRGVTVRMIVGQRGVQPCGDNADKIMQLRRLEVATNKAIQALAKKHKIAKPGSIQFKYFAFMCSDTSRACYGAFHCKWVVTERTCAISTSNYTGDYFALTIGSTFVANVPNGLDSVFPMRDDLVNIFVRDWRSSKLVEDIACQCQIMGWPFKTPLQPLTPQHYFLSTPNGGMSSANVKSPISSSPPYHMITSQDFCSPTCFQQTSSGNVLPSSSCFAKGSDPSVLSEAAPPLYPGKNAKISGGKLVEKVPYFTSTNKSHHHKRHKRKFPTWLLILLIFLAIGGLLFLFIILSRRSAK